MVTVINPEDKTPEMLVKLLGVSESRARFILAMEKGEIEGDQIILDSEGQPEE